MAATRRDLLIGLAVLGGCYGVLRAGADALMDDAPRFEAMERPAGFRRLSAGDVSDSPAGGGFDPLVGVGDAAPVLPEDRLCAVLFGGPPPPGPVPGTVPVAAFSDHNCPYCRVLTPRLAAFAAATPGVRMTWHEWPILAPSSVPAARAALAAGRQGAYVAFRERMRRVPFRPTEGYMRRAAAELDLDADRLVADMNGPGVAREIAESGAAARLLGGIGTPLTVIGRTVVEGAVDMETVADLVERERAAGPIPGCG